MVRPEIKKLHSPDVPDFDLEAYAPGDGEPFNILVEAFIGPAGEIGDEAFNFLVCNPQGLAQSMDRSDYLFARHHLVMKSYDYMLMRSAIEKLCNSVMSPDWQTAALKLSRYGHWEYEDRRPYGT